MRFRIPHSVVVAEAAAHLVQLQLVAQMVVAVAEVYNLTDRDLVLLVRETVAALVIQIVQAGAVVEAEAPQPQAIQELLQMQALAVLDHNGTTEIITLAVAAAQHITDIQGAPAALAAAALEVAQVQVLLVVLIPVVVVARLLTQEVAMELVLTVDLE